MSMQKTVETLMLRDGLSKAEAVEKVGSFFKMMQESGDPWAWEEEFMIEFQLEPDYFEDFLFRLA